MSVPTPITDHVQQGLGKVLTAFKNKPRLSAWLSVPLRQVQQLEDAAAVFLSSFDVDTADLPRLTVLGKIVGQTPFADLETFRRATKVRILVNRSRGRAVDLIKIARILLAPIAGGAPGAVIYTESQPATVTIEATAGVAGLDLGFASNFLNQARLAGVRLNVVASTHDDGLTFSTVAEAIASRTTPDPTQGYAKTNLSDGGYAAQSR